MGPRGPAGQTEWSEEDIAACVKMGNVVGVVRVGGSDFDKSLFFKELELRVSE